MRGLLQPGVVAKKLQTGVNHCLHLIHIAKQSLLLIRIVDKFTAQAHARQRRTQVVGNSREHLGTVFDEVLQLCLHRVEGKNCLTDFLGANRFDGRRPKVDTEASGAFGKLLQRSGQVAGRDQRYQCGGQQHQQNQDQVALPLAQPPTARRDAEHQPGTIGQLHQQAVVTVFLWPIAGLIGFESPHGAIEQTLRKRAERSLHRVRNLR